MTAQSQSVALIPANEGNNVSAAAAGFAVRLAKLAKGGIENKNKARATLWEVAGAVVACTVSPDEAVTLFTDFKRLTGTGEKALEPAKPYGLAIRRAVETLTTLETLPDAKVTAKRDPITWGRSLIEADRKAGEAEREAAAALDDQELAAEELGFTTPRQMLENAPAIRERAAQYAAQRAARAALTEALTLAHGAGIEADYVARQIAEIWGE